MLLLLIACIVIWCLEHAHAFIFCSQISKRYNYLPFLLVGLLTRRGVDVVCVYWFILNKGAGVIWLVQSPPGDMGKKTMG